MQANPPFTDWENMNFEITTTNTQSNIIADRATSNNYTLDNFQLFLSGLDKLHDFGEHFTEIYNLIYEHYFLYGNIVKTNNYTGKKIIRQIGKVGGELVQSDLNLKISSLHKLIDFNSYKAGTPPIYGAPNITIETTFQNSKQMSFNSKAPFAIAPINISKLSDTEFLNNYMSQIPPEKDVILYLRGTKTDFKSDKISGAIQKILDCSTSADLVYVSKDAFPFANEIIDKIFNRTPNGEFTSYTSEIMDPATQNKKLIAGGNSTVKTLFCALPNERRLYLQLTTTAPTSLTLSFGLKENGVNIISGQKNLNLSAITKPPSIQDVVTYLFEEASTYTSNPSEKTNALNKSYGSKLMSAFKKNNKNQTELTKNLREKYFVPLFEAIPIGAKATLADKQLICIATKTIGDQSYLWDALINEGLPGNSRRSFVATIDSFLFEQIIHGKNANAVFASKSNGGTIKNITLGSIYQMAIYLKPVNPDDVEKEIAERDEKMNAIRDEINTENNNHTKNAEAAKKLIGAFRTSRGAIVDHLKAIFSNFKPEEKKRIPSYYTIEKQYSVTTINTETINTETINENVKSFDIGNYYYAACYLLQFMIQCELSLTETISYEHKGNLADVVDMTELKNEVNVIKSANGKYIDALDYYENTLSLLGSEVAVYSYLKGNKASSESSAPDFESVRNSLQQNKSRLEGLLPSGTSKFPSTIGFSNGFFLISNVIVNFFAGYGGTVSGGTVSGGTNNVTEADFIITLDDIFEGEDWDTVFAPNTKKSIDYYELLFILKQLYYLDDVATKTVDDFYLTVYELSERTGLNLYLNPPQPTPAVQSKSKKPVVQSKTRKNKNVKQVGKISQSKERAIMLEKMAQNQKTARKRMVTKWRGMTQKALQTMSELP